MSEKQKNIPKAPHCSSPSTQHCALVLDLGTTTLAGRLLAADGTLLAEARIANPQRPLGADILTRLQRAADGDGAELQRLLIEGVRALVAELLTQAGVTTAQIATAAAAGNPGICHLLLNLPVDKLLAPPHRTPLTEAVRLSLDSILADGDHNNFSPFKGKIALMNSSPCKGEIAFMKSLPLQGGGQEGDGSSSAGILTHPHPNPPLEGEGAPHSSPLTPHKGDSPPAGTVPLTLFPAISGFVGGDLLADLFGISFGAVWGVESLNCAARVESLNRLKPKAEGLDSTAKPSTIQQRSVQQGRSPVQRFNAQE